MAEERRLTFGEFSLDLTEERLLCDREVVALTPKAFAVLRRLVDDGGQVVTKEELLQQSLTDGARRSAMFFLASALIGLGKLDEAYATFTASQGASDITAMPWSAQTRLRYGLGRLWLARRDLDRARREAEGFHALAATADEPTPRALAAHLLAEIALQQGHLPQAEAYVGEALAAIDGCEAPVIEWRIAATAARVHHGHRRRAEAEAARMRSAALVNQLANSLPPQHALRESFLSHAAVRELLRPRRRRRGRRSGREVTSVAGLALPPRRTVHT